jgi:hypothetical protein
VPFGARREAVLLDRGVEGVEPNEQQVADALTKAITTPSR